MCACTDRRIGVYVYVYALVCVDACPRAPVCAWVRLTSQVSFDVLPLRGYLSPVWVLRLAFLCIFYFSFLSPCVCMCECVGVGASAEGPFYVRVCAYACVRMCMLVCVCSTCVYVYTRVYVSRLSASPRDLEGGRQ